MKKRRTLNDYHRVEKATGLKVLILDTGANRFLRIHQRLADGSVDPKNFTDYGFVTPDMEVQIVDEDAYFYYPKDGDPYLDMSPQTLGLKT